MPPISEFERKIKNATIAELEQMLNKYPSGSPFWQLAFDQLQVKKLTEEPNPTTKPSTDISNKKSNWHEKPLGKLFYQVFGGLVLAGIIFLIAQHFGIQL